jgi:SAM-dependent methyltransferase
VLDALARTRASGARILEVGCGTGWLSARLLDFGEVTATDLADEVIARAQAAHPRVRFLAGDFMTLAAGDDYDVVVCLETLSHFVDQPAFVARLASCLRPGGPPAADHAEPLRVRAARRRHAPRAGTDPQLGGRATAPRPCWRRTSASRA